MIIVNYKRVLFPLLTLFVTGWLLFSPSIVLASVEKIVFTTEPQTVLPNQMSEAITIQTQNNEGTKEEVTETMDLVFSSDSSTAEFLGSTGNATTKYMSKNSANRTFYYRDSNLGEHLISITATGRDSGQKFSASQKITISNSVVASSTDDTSSTTENTDSSNQNVFSTNGGYSSHTAQTDLSNSEEITPSIGAGRKRLTASGVPVPFHVERGRGANDARNFVWSFGDGTSAEGETVQHSYQFAGQYNVVLNGFSSKGQSVARTKVEVIEPRVVVSTVNRIAGYVEISNNDKKEINIGNWILSGDKNYKIPSDTIIDGNQKIKIPLGLVADAGAIANVWLLRPNEAILKEKLLTSVATSTQLLVLEKKLSELRSELSVLSHPENQTAGEASVAKVETLATTTKIVLSPKLSWWQKLIIRSK